MKVDKILIKNMKITKRAGYQSPTGTMTIWLIPTISYILQKLCGIQFNQYEFVWWIVIPVLFIVWFILNFKVTKDNETF
jgi:hypothetical protein